MRALGKNGVLLRCRSYEGGGGREATDPSGDGCAVFVVYLSGETTHRAWEDGSFWRKNMKCDVVSQIRDYSNRPCRRGGYDNEIVLEITNSSSSILNAAGKN